MILGTGIDTIDIRRIERVLARHGERFLERIFTAEERRYAETSPPQYAARLAKRFAAKEACAKALGTGMTQGVAWKDIGVIHPRFGAPSLKLGGGALARLQKLTPAGHKAHIHISLTDDAPQALAFVVISALAD